MTNPKLKPGTLAKDFICPECSGPLEIMNVHRDTESGDATEVMGHCWRCDQTYVWTHPAAGPSYCFRKFFHG